MKLIKRIYWRRISQSEIRNSAAESEGGQKFLPPTPSFLPARAFSLARGTRHQFRSKKVRISSNKRTRIKLSGILPTDSDARSAAEKGNTGSPRRARLAKRRFEISCDFKYLLCPKKNFCYNELAPTNQWLLILMAVFGPLWAIIVGAPRAAI